MRWAVSAILLGLLLSSPVQAQECDDTSCELDPLLAEEPLLPEGRRCTVDGETFQCYSLEEYQQLLQLEVDLHFYMESYEALELDIQYYQEIIKELDAALVASAEQVAILSTERTRLYNMWEEENKLRLEAENRPMLGSWVAWGLAAAEAVAILVLSLVVGVGGS